MDLSVLRGRRLLVPVTASRRQLAERLARAGAVVEEVEFIAIEPAADRAALEEATLSWCAGDFEWLAVTSRNAITAMDAIARERGMRLSAPLPTSQVATVGEATRAVCADLGLDVALVPHKRQNARGIVEEFAEGPGRVLVPLGNLAAPVLPRGLERKGWTVTQVEAYRTVDGAGVGRQLREQIESGTFDAILLTSGSVAQRLAQAGTDVPEDTMIVAIGDMTAAAARGAGLTVTAVATAPSYDGIVAGLLAALDPDASEEYDALDHDAPGTDDAADADDAPGTDHAPGAADTADTEDAASARTVDEVAVGEVSDAGEDPTDGAAEHEASLAGAEATDAAGASPVSETSSASETSEAQESRAGDTGPDADPDGSAEPSFDDVVAGAVPRRSPDQSRDGAEPSFDDIIADPRDEERS